MQSISRIATNIVVGILLVISLFLVTFTATHAAEQVSITAVSTGGATTGDVFYVSFSNGVSCQQGQTALNSKDNPVVGAVYNFRETYFAFFFTGYAYTQHGYAMHCD